MTMLRRFFTNNETNLLLTPIDTTTNQNLKEYNKTFCPCLVAFMHFLNLFLKRKSTTYNEQFDMVLPMNQYDK